MTDALTDRLKKALELKVGTSTTRQPWQEALDRYTSIVNHKQSMAAEIVSGLGGSWAAQFTLNPEVLGSVSDGSTFTPAHPQAIHTHLGKPGMPEIYFRPYDYRTNRTGWRGPSLVGHPVAFSVLGPTSKFRHNDWMWDVTDQSATPTLGDTLELAADRFDGGGAPDIVTSLEEIYGITSVPESGLYLVVSMTGERGAITGVGGDAGLGDGFVDAGGYNACSALSPESQFEVFRVTQFQSAPNNKITLDPVKHLADYFTIPGVNPVIRSIMLLVPVASRMQAIAGSGAVGAEKTFVFLPPEKSLNDDMMPSHQEWVTDSQFNPWDGYAAGATGNSDDWDYGQALPVPHPIAEGVAKVPSSPVSVGVNRFRIDKNAGSNHSPSANDVGRVVHIHKVDNSGASTILGNGVTTERLLGWYEVVAVNAGVSMTLRRLTELDPATGVPFYSPPNTFTKKTAGTVLLKYTLHEPISTLWTSATFDSDKVDATRLRNLIDPSLVGRSIKIPGTGLPSITEGRPQRAIFDTSSSNAGAAGYNANPGSLLDLGFKVVLFPAKDSTTSPGTTVPDFDNPITSREVVLDPNNTTEQQYIDIDYSAGTVTLSHTPVPGAGCDIAPNGIVNTGPGDDNPRGEIVLFASFVPYSQEDGQLGGGVRVTGSPNGQDSVKLITGKATSDVFGSRIYYPVKAGTTITSGVDQTIDLELDFPTVLIPPTGYVELLKGKYVDGEPIFTVDNKSAAIFGYSWILDNGLGKCRLSGVFGGKDHAPADTYAVTAATPVTAVFRRDLWQLLQDDADLGTDYRSDTHYGFPYRAKSLHFKHADLTPGVGGSLEVEVKDPVVQDTVDNMADLFSAWVLDGGVVTGNPLALSATIDEATILVQGYRRVIPAQTVTGLAPNDDTYIAFDVADPSNIVVVSFLSLPTVVGVDYILLARVTTNGVGVTETVDLRNPLKLVDQRFDILVGSKNNSVGFAPHFEKLSEAIAYAGEIMEPVTLGAGSTRGPHLRIKVVGFVEEDAADLPIAIPCNGLTIEGVSRNSTGDVATGLTSIQWDANGALIDLNGKSGTVFRNCVFEYTGTAGAAGTRAVFTQSDNMTASNVILENNILMGPCHGLVRTGTTASYLVQSKIIGNRFTDGKPTDYGMAFGSAISYCTIADNFIYLSGAPQTALSSYKKAGVYLTGGSGNTIEGNVVDVGATFGITLDNSVDNRVVGNKIVETLEAGLHIRGANPDRNVIDGNVFTACHTDAATTFAERRVVALSGVGATYTRFVNNYVSLGGGPGAGDQALYMDGETHATIANNQFTYDVYLDESTVFSNNFCTDVIFRSNSELVGNTIVDLTAYSVANTERINIVNNHITGTLSVPGGKSADKCTIANNYISTVDTWNGSFCAITGNYIGTDLILSATASNTITGNIISDESPGDLVIEGSCVVTGNIVLGGIISAPNYADQSLIQGNVVLTQTGGYGINVGSAGGAGGQVFIKDNILVDGGVYYDGQLSGGGPTNHAIISGNCLRGTTRNIVVKDTLYLTIADNILTGSITATDTIDYIKVHHNRVDVDIDVSAGAGTCSDPDIIGNVVGGNLVADTTTNATVALNRVAGNIDLGGAGTGATDPIITGNRVGGNIYAKGSTPCITGNIVTGDVQAASGDTTTVPAGDAVIVGNIVKGGNIYASTPTAGSDEIVGNTDG